MFDFFLGTHQRINVFVVLTATTMMGVAYFYFQLHLGLLPCPLCVTQRIFTIGFGVTALISLIFKPAHLGQIKLALVGLISAICGASVSARQVWLQSLPADQAPTCGPTLPYLMEYFPLADVMSAMFLGEGSCAEIKWSLFGFSIPAWVLVAFIIIIAVLCYQILFAKRLSNPS